MPQQYVTPQHVFFLWWMLSRYSKKKQNMPRNNSTATIFSNIILHQFGRARGILPAQGCEILVIGFCPTNRPTSSRLRKPASECRHDKGDGVMAGYHTALNGTWAGQLTDVTDKA